VAKKGKLLKKKSRKDRRRGKGRSIERVEVFNTFVKERKE